MLAVKAIQDWQLYSGQEASTRYMDFGNQEGEWFDFYRLHLPAVQDHVAQQYPELADKGIKARAFDIMRAFLPAGAKTQFSWHTNFRQAYDHLIRLLYHPLIEVQTLASNLLMALKEKYPASFSHRPLSEEQEAYFKYCGAYLTYLDDYNFEDPRFHSWWVGEPVDPHVLGFSERPKFTELPFSAEQAGHFRFKFTMDFGSYRDLARHRNGVIMVTQLSTKLGFEPWYLRQLPSAIVEAVGVKLAEVKDHDPYEIPMGYKVGIDCTFPLNAAVYLVELRTGKTVHPTLRSVAIRMAAAINEKLGIKLHVDSSLDNVLESYSKRAQHDITERNN